MGGFRVPDLPREHRLLFPTLLDDAIPEHAPVRVFLDILSHQAFQETVRTLEQQYDLLEGRPPFHPKYLVALYLYGMIEGIRSSRQLERACRNRTDVIWLMEGQEPDHATIAGFVRRHREILLQLFKDTLDVGQSSGLIKLRHVAVDGTKIEANASRGSVKSEEWLAAESKRLDEEIARIDKEWKENEVRDHSLFLDDEDHDASKNELREAMNAKRKRVAAALEAIVRRRSEVVDKKGAKPVASITDPDARHMKDKEGRVKPNFNVQMAVDSTAEMIVAQQVNDLSHDNGLLLPMVESIVKDLGSAPSEVSADKAYNLGHDLTALEEMKTVAYVPEIGCDKPTTPEGRAAVEALASGKTLSEAEWSALPKGSNKKISREVFVFDPATETYRCPAGQVLTAWRVCKEKQRATVSQRTEFRTAPGVCAACPFAALCCENPAQGRMITRDQHEDSRTRARERLKTVEGKTRYAIRSHLAETPNAQIKGGWGFRRFLRRGFAMVRVECVLAISAYNIRILMKHVKTSRLGAAGLLGPPAAPALSTA